tara:strand:+ start:417 stop:650 length:234 start_codon:yes stop_codon:yes gene_type:complete
MNNMTDMNYTKIYEYVKKNNYLLVYPDESIKLYKSLREIETDILVSTSSISRALKEEDYCIVTSSTTNFTFFIKKLL